MAKKNYKKWYNWLMWLIAIVTGVGIGGLFINGTFASTVLLSFIPQVIHTLIGWIIIISSIGGAIYHLFIK